MTMTESRPEDVTRANRTGDRPFMRRMSVDELLAACAKMDHQPRDSKSIEALRSAWSETGLGRYRSELPTEGTANVAINTEPEPRAS
jgi:hypothetical protein